MPAIGRNYMSLGAAGQGRHDEVIWRQDASFDDGGHRPVRRFECTVRPLGAPPAIRPGAQPIDCRRILNDTVHRDFLRSDVA
ncbi:hypothetical protein [Bradyrhizobium sp. USDA 223]|uniref:hypothetical protein n=1 Tax=Bradyrhizobium sp. USDA 223 TaxID=3156306 RepID=UPI003832695B